MERHVNPHMVRPGGEPAEERALDRSHGLVKGPVFRVLSSRDFIQSTFGHFL